jgi:hypothetical protein
MEQAVATASSTGFWYTDPRWWAIIATAVVGLASLALGIVNLILVRRDKAREIREKAIERKAAPVRDAIASIYDLVDRTSPAAMALKGKGNDEEREATRTFSMDFTNAFSKLQRRLKSIENALPEEKRPHYQLSFEAGNVLGQIIIDVRSLVGNHSDAAATEMLIARIWRDVESFEARINAAIDLLGKAEIMRRR